MALFSLLSCESEIPFTYNSIEPIYVIQANFLLDEFVSRAEVYISTTQDVDSTTPAPVITDAMVKITTPEGSIIPLAYDGDSLYIANVFGCSLEPLQGDFTIDVEIDDNHFSTGCELKPSAEIIEPVFYWQDVMGEMGILMMKAMINDTAGEDNYYKYKFTLSDGEAYQQGIISDNGMDGKVLELYAQFNPDESLGYYTISEDMAGSLYLINEGEEIIISVSQIDERPYNFISTIGSSTSNPVSQFDDCLGYFVVSTMSSLTINFSAEDIIVL